VEGNDNRTITTKKHQIMSTETTKKKDPYAALRYREFNIFLLRNRILIVNSFFLIIIKHKYLLQLQISQSNKLKKQSNNSNSIQNLHPYRYHSESLFPYFCRQYI